MKGADAGRAETDAGLGEALGCGDVIKRYQDGDGLVEAVAGVTLSVPRGALWVLRGPSGSGKTTLLGLLGGLVPPTSGDVRIGGTSVVHLRDHHRTALRRKQIGFAFQDLALISGLTLRENVLLPLAPVGGADLSARERAEVLLTRFGLADRSDRAVERLSGGERQRGAIARALILAPKALLLDEPTAHLDADNAATITDLLIEERERGTCVVAATHDPRLASDARVDQVLDLADGQLVE